MYYWVESIVVGIYCTLLYSILSLFSLSSYVLLFLLGFSKHLFGYFLGLHSYFCKKYKKHSIFDPVLCQSILEGFYFMIVGIIVFYFIELYLSKIIIIFIFGMVTHLLSEWIGLHSSFVNSNCV